MTKQKSRWWYVTKSEHLEGHSVGAVMDMLRYDGARVECNAPVGFWLLSKEADGGYPPPNEERWRSFMIRVYVICKSPYAPSREEVSKVVAEEDRLSEARKAKA